MFKKAEKSELRTWLIGDGFLTLCCLFASMGLIGYAFNTEFKLKALIWGIVFALITILLAFFFALIIKALVTYEDRAALRKEREEAEKAQKEQEEAERIALEKAEMDALREEETRKREEMLAKLEEEKAEAEKNGKTYGEDNE